MDEGVLLFYLPVYVRLYWSVLGVAEASVTISAPQYANNECVIQSADRKSMMPVSWFEEGQLSQKEKRSPLKHLISAGWRRWRDSNSRALLRRLLHFECRPFNHLGTSPDEKYSVLMNGLHDFEGNNKRKRILYCLKKWCKMPDTGAFLAAFMQRYLSRK